MKHEERYIAAKEKYTAMWKKETTKEILNELESWRKYFDKHSAAYSWHGKDITPPGCLADGDKVLILKEILKERGVEDV